MTYGDPFKFSIIVDIIADWNLDNTFQNGVLAFCVDGIFFPNEIVNATLKREVPILKDKLKTIVVDKSLFTMPKENAFKEMYLLTYPTDYEKENDYRFCISPDSLRDHHYFIFAVSDGEAVRILASELEYSLAESVHELHDIEINESFLSLIELNAMTNKIDLSE